MHRVVITGIGAMTSLGNSFSESGSSLLNGTSGVGIITKFDASTMHWKVAGEIKGFQADPFFTLKEQKRLDLFAQYAVATAVMAVADAGLSLEVRGHSDSLLHPTERAELARQRGEVVAAEIVAQGVAPARVTAYGASDSEPRYPPDDPRNRRVEFIIAERADE